MKKIIVGLLFLVVSIVTAQNEVSVKLENIDVLKVSNGLKVNLIKSEEQKLEIHGEEAGSVTFKNKRGTLKLGLKFGSSFDSKKVEIDLYYNSNIGELDVNQGALIISKEIFEQKQLKLNSQDGSSIKLEIEVDYLKIKGVSGGNIQLKGIAKSQNVKLVSGASYKGFDLHTNQTIIYVSTGAVAEIQVSGILDAKSKFGASIIYSGQPNSISTEESIGGKITKY
ncbi:DUF2807 domain-containing protein [Flavicella sp.]|uniref:GIN domain-containing protein n=1 Tax=Flavicella sp. TaxID=2957742 RepID=UPI003017D0EE